MKDKINILVVQIGKIGDMILTTPLLGCLKRIFPESELSVLASPNNSTLAKNLVCVDRTHVYDKKALSTAKLLLSLRQKSYDYWIDPKDEYSSTSKILERLSGPKLSIGFNIKDKVFDINLQNFVRGKHRVDINLASVNYLSEPNEYNTAMPHVDIPPKDSLIIDGRLEGVKGKFVLLNMSAGDRTRYLKPEVWAELAGKINSDMNIVLTGLEKDYNNINSVINSVKRSNVFFLKANTIFEFAELIRRCDLLVTPDTSAIHLASCFNTPVAAMYHNVQWNIIKFGPLSDKYRIIISKNENSLESISSGELITAVNELLS